jgi:hypothetical protein
LTKADEVSSADLNMIGYENIFESGHIDAVVNSFVHQTGIPKSYVFPVVNYIGPSKNLVVECLCLDAFQHVLEEAVAKLRRDTRNYIQVHDMDSKAKLGILEISSREEKLVIIDKNVSHFFKSALKEDIPAKEFQFLIGGRVVPKMEEHLHTIQECMDTTVSCIYVKVPNYEVTQKKKHLKKSRTQSKNCISNAKEVVLAYLQM